MPFPVKGFNQKEIQKNGVRFFCILSQFFDKKQHANLVEGNKLGLG